jgi:hypothetical protein
MEIKYVVLSFIILKLCSVSAGLRDDYRGRSDAYRDFISSNYKSGKIYVDRWESPCFRYLFEYGKLKGTADYPSSFTFMKGEKHSRKENKCPSKKDYYLTQPYLNDLYDEYDLLITPELYQYKSDFSDKWCSVNNNERVWVKKPK